MTGSAPHNCGRMNAEAVRPRLRGFACANAQLTDLADARLLLPSDLSSAGAPFQRSDIGPTEAFP
jgi:hypothetical protein